MCVMNQLLPISWFEFSLSVDDKCVCRKCRNGVSGGRGERWKIETIFTHFTARRNQLVSWLCRLPCYLRLRFPNNTWNSASTVFDSSVAVAAPTNYTTNEVSLFLCVCVFVRVRWCWRARRHRHLLTAQKRFINMRWVDVGRRLYVLCAIVVCRVTIVLFGLWLEVCWVQQCAASPTAGLSSSRNITTPGEGIPYK